MAVTPALAGSELISVTEATVCAGFGVRFAAELIDQIILIVPTAVLGLLLATNPVLDWVAFLLMQFVYFAFFWTESGSTPGKKAMGLRVVRRDGELLDMTGSLIRYAATWVSSFPFALGYLWAIWDPKHETWHDKIAGTKVIRVR